MCFFTPPLTNTPRRPSDTAAEQDTGLTRPASQAALVAPPSPGPNSTKAPATPTSPLDADAVAAAVGMALDARAAAAAGGGGDALSKKRAYKEKFQEGVAIFNAKPKKGIAFLQVGLVHRGAGVVVALLRGVWGGHHVELEVVSA